MKFGFVDCDPPTLVVVSKHMVLLMTLGDTAKFDPEKSSIYKRAAQTFDGEYAQFRIRRQGALGGH